MITRHILLVVKPCHLLVHFACRKGVPVGQKLPACGGAVGFRQAVDVHGMRLSAIMSAKSFVVGGEAATVTLTGRESFSAAVGYFELCYPLLLQQSISS